MLIKGRTDTNRVFNGKKYGLILEGKWTTRAHAKAVAASIRNTIGLSARTTPITVGAIPAALVYLEGAKGTRFSGKKAVAGTKMATRMQAKESLKKKKK